MAKKPNVCVLRTYLLINTDIYYNYQLVVPLVLHPKVYEIVVVLEENALVQHSWGQSVLGLELQLILHKRKVMKVASTENYCIHALAVPVRVFDQVLLIFLTLEKIYSCMFSRFCKTYF